jgi:CheY-like chemotaxis protein
LQKLPVISIVDDDEAVRLALRSLVRSLGYVSKVFASAEEFLESSHLNETSCLISDVQMPGMNGIELQRRLKTLDYGTPVIFVTAFPDERSKARAFEAGAIGFLEKPFEGRAIIKLIEMALRAGGERTWRIRSGVSPAHVRCTTAKGRLQLAQAGNGASEGAALRPLDIAGERNRISAFAASIVFFADMKCQGRCRIFGEGKTHECVMTSEPAARST